jgi:hypothetical protein
MKTVEEIFRSEAQRSSRASERTAPPKTDGRATDVEIAYLQKLSRDLATGLANLRSLRPAPYDFNVRLLAQAAKLRSVEEKLFRLRQGRLL